ncbi:hypothetical protein BJX76DRAFT_359938 [Aspergillus varians]
MQLRTTVRLPQRLNQDLLDLPMSKRHLRSDYKRRKPRYIDYNPNMPPAAFPTLDNLRTPPAADSRGVQRDGHGEDTGGDLGEKENIRKSLEDLCSLMNPDAQAQEQPSTASARLEGIPTDQLDNCIASNGDLNPIWMSNMARIRATGQDAGEDMDMDMEDSDLDAMVTEETKFLRTGPRNPNWADLSDRMQAEILENLLERYSYHEARRMLGLTIQERNTVQEALEYRKEQAELEDTQLEAMRARQLRELSRIDNSIRSQMQSYQLGFRKASRQTFRRLKEAMDPDVDFFACEASELTTARNFLRKRGIEVDFAGVWGNDISLIHTSKEEEKKLSFETVGHPGPNNNTPVADIRLTSNEAHPISITATSTTSSESIPSTAVKEKFLNRTRDLLPTGDKLEFMQRNCDPITLPRWLDLLQKTIYPERNYRKKRKRYQFDHVGWQDRTSIPPEYLCLRKPPLDFDCSEELALGHWQQPPSNIGVAQRTSTDLGSGLGQRRGTAPLSLSLPKDRRLFVGLGQHLRRSNSEPASQHAGPPYALLHRVPSIGSRRLKEKEEEEEARQHTDTQQLGQEQEPITKDTENCIDSDLKDLVKSWTFIPLSPSPTPSPTYGETKSPSKLFQFSNRPSPETVATHDSPPTSTSSSLTEDDDDCDDDEVVLLPMSR